MTERALTPLCIRFRPQDLEALRLVAAKQGEGATVFLRELVMMRVVSIESDLSVPRLRYTSNGVVGAPISIRFRPPEYKRAARIAAQEGVPFGLWARAVALEYISRKTVQRQERQTAVGE